jgi:hypothetical protein
MIVSAMAGIPEQEGTALQIFDAIEALRDLQDELDTRIMPGTLHVPRWGARFVCVGGGGGGGGVTMGGGPLMGDPCPPAEEDERERSC